MTREEMISALTTNCNCGCSKETLNKMTDEELAKLHTNARRAGAMARTLGSIGKNFGLNASITLNEMPEALQKAIDKKNGKEDEEKEDDEEMEQNAGSSSQASGGGKGVQAGGKGTKDEYNTNALLAKLPPTVRAAIKRGIEAGQREKAATINQLVANAGVEGQQAQALHNRLSGRSIEDLQLMLSLQGGPRADAPVVNADPLDAVTLNFLGAEPPPPVPTFNSGGLGDDDVLPLPTVNWGKEDKKAV